MADRYDLKTTRQGNDGKTYYTKVGVMFPWKSGKGFNISLEAMPLMQMNDQGQIECRVMAMEPFKDDDSAHNKAKADGYQPEPQAKMEPLDDEVPF